MQSFTARITLAGGNQRIQIREKTPELSSTLLSSLSPYLYPYLYETVNANIY